MAKVPLLPLNGFAGTAVSAETAAAKAAFRPAPQIGATIGRTVYSKFARHADVVKVIQDRVTADPSLLPRLAARLPGQFPEVPTTQSLIAKIKNNKLLTAVVGYEILEEGNDLYEWIVSDDGPQAKSAADKTLIGTIISVLRGDNEPGGANSSSSPRALAGVIPDAPDGTGDGDDASKAYLIERAHKAFQADVYSLGGPLRVAALFRVLTTDEDYRNLWLSIMAQGR